MAHNEADQSRWFVDEILPHESNLRGWLKARFSSISDIDDIVQEAYTRLLKAYETGPIVNPRAYLFVVSKNIALKQIRRLRHECVPGVEVMDYVSIADEVSGPVESLVSKEEIQLLINAIQSLPRRCRQVITLRKIYGLSQEEVARHLEISVHTVEAHARIGLRKCIDYFRDFGYITRLEK